MSWIELGLLTFSLVYYIYCLGPYTTTLVSHKEKRCIVRDLDTSLFPSAVPGLLDTNTYTTNAIDTNTS